MSFSAVLIREYHHRRHRALLHYTSLLLKNYYCPRRKKRGISLIRSIQYSAITPQFHNARVWFHWRRLRGRIQIKECYYYWARCELCQYYKQDCSKPLIRYRKQESYTYDVLV